ncbi:MAG: hypothetical protein ACKOXB_12470 [Flavobacteriales bacterium]
MKIMRERPQCPPLPVLGVPMLAPNSLYDLDNIFRPFEMDIHFFNQTTQVSSSKVYYEEIFVDALHSTGQSFMANVGKAIDSNGDVTLFAFPYDKLFGNNIINNQKFSLVGDVDDSTSFLARVANKLGFDFTANNVNIPGVGIVEVASVTNVQSATISSFKSANADDFMFLKISSADYTTITGFSTTSNFLPGFPIYLGIQHSNFFNAANPLYTYHECEIVLRGYIVDPLNNNEIILTQIDTGVLNYRRELRGAVRMLFDKVISRTVIRKGKPFEIEDLGLQDFEEQIQEMQSQTSTDVSAKRIKATVYLYRGDGMIPEDFCKFKHYVDDVIHQIWDSTTNKGIGNVYNPADGPGLQFDRKYIVDASGIEVREASMRQLIRLNEGESLFLVTASLGTGQNNRSFVYGGGRGVGVLHYDPNLNAMGAGSNDPYVPLGHYYAPAHEFGHILGLKDRYVYYGLTTHEVYKGAVPGRSVTAGVNTHYVIPPTPLDNGFAVNDSLTGATPTIGGFLDNGTGGSMPMYHDGTKDGDYSQRYSWMHNLMSTIEIVPTIAVTNTAPLSPLKAIRQQPTFVEFHKYYRPENPVNYVGLVLFEKITCFITAFQIEVICGIQSQDIGGDRFMYFPSWKHYGADSGVPDLTQDYIFRGSFIGKDDSTEALYSDHRYQASTTAWNLNDHLMILRRQDTATGTVQTDRVEGCFSPYLGETSLPTGSPVQENSDPINFQNFVNTYTGAGGGLTNQIASLDIFNVTNSTPPLMRAKPTIYDLELGGSATGVGNINEVRNVLVSIRANNSIISANDQSVFSRHYVVTGGQNYKLSTSFSNDSYAAYGLGDAVGKKIWKASVKNNSNGMPGSTNFDLEINQCVPNNLILTGNGLGNPDQYIGGLRPYEDGKWDFPFGNNTTNANKVPTPLYLEYSIYFNRRVIIQIMGENAI